MKTIATIIWTLLTIGFIVGACVGCASTDYLAEAQACGQGPECAKQWKRWNRNEDRKAAREQHAALVRGCNNVGGILVEFRGKYKCRSKAWVREQLEAINRGRF